MVYEFDDGELITDHSKRVKVCDTCGEVIVYEVADEGELLSGQYKCPSCKTTLW